MAEESNCGSDRTRRGATVRDVERPASAELNARMVQNQPTIVDEREALELRRPYLEMTIRAFFPARREISILDVGCGSGALLYFLRKLGYQDCEGVDAVAEQVAAAKRMGIRGVRQADAIETLTVAPSESRDVIVAFDVLEHLNDDKLNHFLHESRRVLKPAGRVIIHTCNAGSPFGMLMRYGDITHQRAFTKNSIEQILRTHNFIDIRCIESVPVIHGLKSAARAMLWKIMRSFLSLFLLAEMGTAEGAILTQNFLIVAFRP